MKPAKLLGTVILPPLGGRVTVVQAFQSGTVVNETLAVTRAKQSVEGGLDKHPLDMLKSPCSTLLRDSIPAAGNRVVSANFPIWADKVLRGVSS